MQSLNQVLKDTTLTENENSTSRKYLEHFDIKEEICSCSNWYESEFKMYIPNREEPVLYTNNKCWDCQQAENIENMQAEWAKQAAEQRKKNILKRFDNESLINPKLKEASFENYEPTSQDLEKAKQVTKRYAENFSKDNPVSLLLIGNYGTGRSQLSVSMIKEIMDKDLICIFISTPKVLTKLRSTYNKGSEYTEEQIIESLTKVDCLVLDDIGSEQSGQKQDENNQTWATSKLFEIIDSRIGKHTIFTSNFTPEELQQRLGGRNFSRMMENTHVIKMYGDDYRLRRFK